MGSTSAQLGIVLKPLSEEFPYPFCCRALGLHYSSFLLNVAGAPNKMLQMAPVLSLYMIRLESCSVFLDSNQESAISSIIGEGIHVGVFRPGFVVLRKKQDLVHSGSSISNMISQIIIAKIKPAE
jgi:hypothetical protein